MITIYDKFLALILAMAGLAALVFGHLVDGAETAALFAAVGGTAGVIGLQMLAAVIHAVIAQSGAGQAVAAVAEIDHPVTTIPAPPKQGGA